jgi:hypothetical protein
MACRSCATVLPLTLDDVPRFVLRHPAVRRQQPDILISQLQSGRHTLGGGQFLVPPQAVRAQTVGNGAHESSIPALNIGAWGSRGRDVALPVAIGCARSYAGHGGSCACHTCSAVDRPPRGLAGPAARCAGCMGLRLHRAETALSGGAHGGQLHLRRPRSGNSGAQRAHDDDVCGWCEDQRAADRQARRFSSDSGLEGCCARAIRGLCRAERLYVQLRAGPHVSGLCAQGRTRVCLDQHLHPHGCPRACGCDPRNPRSTCVRLRTRCSTPSSTCRRSSIAERVLCSRTCGRASSTESRTNFERQHGGRSPGL